MDDKEILEMLPPEAIRKLDAAASAEDYDHHADVGSGLYLSIEERDALRALLDREETSRPSYDGLRQLLCLSHSQSDALLGLLRRI